MSTQKAELGQGVGGDWLAKMAGVDASGKVAV